MKLSKLHISATEGSLGGLLVQDDGSGQEISIFYLIHGSIRHKVQR